MVNCLTFIDAAVGVKNEKERALTSKRDGQRREEWKTSIFGSSDDKREDELFSIPYFVPKTMENNAATAASLPSLFYAGAAPILKGASEGGLKGIREDRRLSGLSPPLLFCLLYFWSFRLHHQGTDTKGSPNEGCLVCNGNTWLKARSF